MQNMHSSLCWCPCAGCRSSTYSSSWPARASVKLECQCSSPSSMRSCISCRVRAASSATTLTRRAPHLLHEPVPVICSSGILTTWMRMGILGYPRTSWDIPAHPGISQDILPWSWDIPGHPGISQDILGYAGISHDDIFCWDIPAHCRISWIKETPEMHTPSILFYVWICMHTSPRHIKLYPVVKSEENDLQTIQFVCLVCMGEPGARRDHGPCHVTSRCRSCTRGLWL
jgi:hypothetical protein